MDKGVSSLRRFCSGCGGLIFGCTFLSDLTRHYHEDCLLCQNCRAYLTQSLVDVAGCNYCLRCYQEIYLPRCAKCDMVITSGSSSFIHGMHYHSVCVRCFLCPEEICADEVFIYEKHFYCTNCFTSGRYANRTDKMITPEFDASVPPDQGPDNE